MWTNFSRVLRTAFQQMHRHGWQTIAALSVISLTLFVISLFILVGLGSNVVLNYFEKQPQMVVFFKKDVEDARIHEVQQALEATNQAESIHYTNKEEALEFYKQQAKDDPALTRNLTSNIFQASLDVSPKDINDIDQLAAVVEDKKFAQFVDEVSYPRVLTDRLASWTSTTRLIGIGLILFLVVLSFLIMMVTIGLNIASYREEISVMRLVGASNWYIRGPFVLEGIIYGVVASVLAVGIVYATLPWVAPRLQSWFEGINIFPIPVLPVFGGMLLFELALGVVLGVVGSYVAMRRSLKV
jgi:cell division transport system permease protein